MSADDTLKRRTWPGLLVLVALLAGACADDATIPLVATTGAAIVAATPVLTPRATPASAPLPAVLLPDPLDLSEYSNGDEVKHLLEGEWQERRFPPELMDSAPPISKEEGVTLWTGFLTNSRVFFVRPETRRVREVRDFCVRTSTFRYSPLYPDGGNLFVGMHVTWRVVETPLTEAKRPRLVDPLPGGVDQTGYLQRGYDAIRGAYLAPPEIGGAPRSSDHSGSELRVFDHPGCDEITPVVQVDPAQWKILGLGVRKSILDYIQPDEPQLPEDELLERWGRLASDIMVFDNLSGIPIVVACRDGRGLVLGLHRFGLSRLGQEFRWRISDARAFRKNAIFFEFEWPNERLRILHTVEQELDPYWQMVGVDFPDCTVEGARRYVQQIGP